MPSVADRTGTLARRGHNGSLPGSSLNGCGTGTLEGRLDSESYPTSVRPHSSLQTYSEEGQEPRDSSWLSASSRPRRRSQAPSLPSPLLLPSAKSPRGSYHLFIVVLVCIIAIDGQATKRHRRAAAPKESTSAAASQGKLLRFTAGADTVVGAPATPTPRSRLGLAAAQQHFKEAASSSSDKRREAERVYQRS